MSGRYGRQALLPPPERRLTDPVLQVAGELAQGVLPWLRPVWAPELQLEAFIVFSQHSDAKDDPGGRREAGGTLRWGHPLQPQVLQLAKADEAVDDASDPPLNVVWTLRPGVLNTHDAERRCVT